ncbi:hypothetical protein Tco_1499441 [Tanacetum coccineum]
MGGQTRPRNYQYLGSPQKAFIQRYCPPSMTAKQLEDIHNFKQEGDESLYQAWEWYNDLLYKFPTHDINNHQKTMADHSQKWHDGTTSKKIRGSSSNDGLAALVNKLDNLGRDMKKLKESVHAIQVRYGEFRRTTPFNGNDGGKFRVGPPGYYTKTDNRPPYGERRQSLEELLAKHQEESARRNTKMEVWIKKLQENAEINTRNQNASLKNLETQIEQLTDKLYSRKEKYKQAKVIIVEHKGPNSPKKLKNLHGISFLFDSQEENTIDQLPTKESNPGHFTLPCTIDLRTCNNYKNLSETQLEHEKEDELVVVVVKVVHECRDCIMVVKEIVNRLLGEVEFEQDIDDEEGEDEEGEGGSEV